VQVTDEKPVGGEIIPSIVKFDSGNVEKNFNHAAFKKARESRMFAERNLPKKIVTARRRRRFSRAAPVFCNLRSHPEWLGW
jgi:hypothetical protein